MAETRLFKGITDEERDKMYTCAGARELKFKAGEYIFRQGDTPESIYLILEGSVMLVKDFASGKRSVLYSVGAKDVFGEMFVFSSETQYWYDAVASEPVRLMEIPRRFFYGFCTNACKKHQDIVKNMLEIQSDKNFIMVKKLYLLSGKTLRESIAMRVLDNAGDGDRFSSSMKREELADYLGTTRPSLSRELMNMQDEGMIVVDRSDIRILDREALEDMSE